MGSDLPVGRCQETISLTALSAPGVCSWSLCPAAIRTPGRPCGRGGGGGGGKRGGVADRRRGRKSTRSTSCPAGHVSAVRRAFTFYMRSESKSRAAEAAVSGTVTAAVIFLCCHYTCSLLFFLSHFFQSLSQCLLLKFKPARERKCGPLLGHDRSLGSQSSSKILLLALGVTRASRPPTKPQTPSFSPFCCSRLLQTALGTSPTWPD